LQPGQPIVSIFPGGRVEGFQATLPVFQQLSETLSREKGIQVVLSVADSLIEDPTVKVCGLTLKEHMEKGKSHALRVLPGMHLELLSLSTLAIAGCGAITTAAREQAPEATPETPNNNGVVSLDAFRKK
jgi:lipid A disaccharide synthetase